MNIFYIDYENVSSQGLKGVEALTENDEVILLYSKKADNVKIDILTTLMASKAKIRFLPVHVGTPNALDFQLVTLLFLNYSNDDFCYIISKDSGYDCCIKTAAENGAPNVARYPNIESAVNKVITKKKSRGRRMDPEQKVTADLNAPAQPEAAASLDNAQDASSPVSDDGAKKKPSRKRGRKKTSAAEAEGTQASSDTLENEPEKPSVPENTQQMNPDSEKPQQNKPASDHLHQSIPVSDKPQAKNPAPEKPQQKSPAPEKPQEADRPQEQVLQQRYLSRQFEAKNPPASGPLSKGDDSKPVSILSVIRRRNDVQLDMHQIDLIREALKNSGNKQQFYNYFVKKLGQKQGIELYHSIKSSYTDLVNANLS